MPNDTRHSKDQAIRVCQIGISQARADAPAKAMGKELYAADFYQPGMLWAGVKRAGVPHARLISIDTQAARREPGVAVVLTSQDVIGGNRHGVAQKDQPVLVDDKVRYTGDALALVVAESKTALARALDLIKVELEPLPAIFDPDQALEPDAPLLHANHPTGNLLLQAKLEQGEAQAAFAQCSQRVEAVFELPRQEHAYLETEAGWARLEDSGELVIAASTQAPFRDRGEVADSLGLPLEKVRIVSPYPGGAFGGKDGITVQCLLGLAALACPGRAVKMWLSREESFLVSCKRHSATLRYRLGADDNGALKALLVEATFDTGPYDHLGGVVMTLAMEHAGGPYHIPNLDLDFKAVYTNNPLGGAFRGFGVPQAASAIEQAMDMLAAKLGKDPLELRLQNIAARGQKTGAGVTLNCSTGLEQCLQKVQEHLLWKNREKWRLSAPAHCKRGVGICALMQGIGYGPVVPDVAGAKLELTAEGRVRVYSGVVDMGQGNASTCLQIAGDVLSQGMENLELVLPDTGRTLASGSATGSRTTFTYGVALHNAALALKERILEKASELVLGAEPSQMALAPGLVRHLPSGEEISLERVAAALSPPERTVTRRHRAPVASERPLKEPIMQLHGFPHAVYAFAAHLAAIEVDMLTGQIQVANYLAISDCGRILNPQLIEQQMEGAVAQGLGYALCEDFMAQEGTPLTGNLSTYIIPTVLDLPPIESGFVETYEPLGPLGMKGAGELGINGPLAAVANALHHACGIRLQKFPLTPQRVLAELDQQAEQGGRN